MSKKQKIFKVETYIVPHVNRFPPQRITNEIDDIANQCDEYNNIRNQPCAREARVHNDERETFLNSGRIEIARRPAEDGRKTVFGVKNVTASESEILSDRSSKEGDDDDDNEEACRYDQCIATQRTEFKISIGAQDMLYPARQFGRVNSLMSIDERSEGSDTRLTDFCHHGYKNGCTATIPSPEEVSEEIFHEHWLQKIEVLRQQEITLREREARLQTRERDVFRRERELRIAERALKDMQRQVEQQLKLQRDLETVQKKLERPVPPAVRELECQPLEDNKDRSRNSDEYARIDKAIVPQPPISLHEKDKELSRKMHPIRPKNPALSRQFGSSTNTNFNSYSSMRYKERIRPRYDDLDSTLSADVGDSSFVCTSKLFNPEEYKKPYAFTRSASERLVKRSQVALAIEENPKHIEEDKVFRKLNENICVSQDKDTRFQNYGPVDCIAEDPRNKAAESQRDPSVEGKLAARISHNQESNDRTVWKPVGPLKDRPISWNEETDKWLQKKREAYNNSTMLKSCIRNKENLKSNDVTEQVAERDGSKKKNKIFAIFR